MHGNHKHGESGRFSTCSAEYRIWADMKYRCDKVGNKNWKSYGGRGISYATAWTDYAVFLRDMGRRPTSKHTLERKDVNGPYSKENCGWATTLVQNRNMRRTKLSPSKVLVIRADPRSNKDIAADYGIHPTYVSMIKRYKRWAEIGGERD